MPDKPMALVVEDDVLQRASVATLLEESRMDVFQCESAEAAEIILEKAGSAICLLFTDVNLAGFMSGIELANIAASRYPHMRIVITSGREVSSLPAGTTFMQKPWNSLDVLQEANDACHPH
jgi:two-component system cell cycle response regulator CpdR